MPFTIKLEGRPAGYAADAALPGETVRTIVREFTSTEDGELFISRLEGLPDEILARVRAQGAPEPSIVDHLVAVIAQDLNTTVFVNECKILIRVRAARAIQVGEPVGEDDIADVDAMRFENVQVPADAGVVCVFSRGWRKGLFFDVAPLCQDASPRDYDLEKVLGSYYAYLANQSIFSLSDIDWQRWFEQGWFPFVSLPKRVVRQMVAASRSGQLLQFHFESILQAVNEMLPAMRRRWEEAALFQAHMPLLGRAVERFQNGDYMSATALLYPRIEGLLRAIHEAASGGGRRSARDLSRSAVQRIERDVHEHSWLLPDRFEKFLREVYFASFEPGGSSTLSRHSVAHGVAAAEEFDAKSACVGLLIVDQLRFFIPRDLPPNDEAATAR